MMGSCVGTRRKADHRESIWSATTLKEPYFNSSYALLVNYKTDEEVLTTMAAIRSTIEGGHVDAECFVDNFTAECLISLMDHEKHEVKKGALITLKCILVQESRSHPRDTPISPLLVDCGFFQKLKKLFDEDPKDFEMIQAGVECLSGIVMEEAATLQIIIEHNLVEVAAKLLSVEATPPTTQKTILDFLLAIFRIGNSAQTEYYCENAIAGPLAEAACSGDENAELALKCLNLLLKKNVRR